MTPPEVQERVFAQFRAAIGVRNTHAELDQLAELVRGSRGARRLTHDQYQTLTAQIAVRRAALAHPVVAYTIAADAGDCLRCGSPMRREVGPWDSPAADGHLIVDEQDVCTSPVCRAQWPVLGEGMEPREIRSRVARVVGHRPVVDHTGCGVGEPCNVARPGLRGELAAVPDA